MRGALFPAALLALAGAGPVGKVVQLLSDMREQLEKEGQNDEETYEKVSCWCETNGGEKLAAVEDADTRIKKLTSTIEAAGAKSDQLAQEIAEVEQEIADDQAALDQATSLRQKALDEFTTEERDLLQSIQSLKDAIAVLSKHHRAPEEELLSIAAMVKHELRVHKQLLKRSASGPIVALAQGSAPRPGEIFGILQQMLETFESSASAAQKQELADQKEYEELKAAKQAEIGAGESQLNAKRNQLAVSDSKRAAAKLDLQDTQAALSADQKFLLELKARCKTNEEDFASRKKARAEEVSAVSQAISILSSDDGRDTISKAVGFVQLSSSRADRAARILEKAAALEGRSAGRLARLAVEARSGALDKVVKAIEEMVVTLKQEKQDEVAHRDFCVRELAETAKQQALQNRELDGLAARLDDLGMTVDALAEDLAAHAAELKNLQLQVKRAGEDRKMENADFQTTVAEQRAAQEVLGQALAVLEKVYSRPAALLQRQPLEPAGSNPPPPAGFKEYKQAGAGGPLGLLRQIIADAHTMENNAIRAEQDSQSAYEAFVRETNGVADALQAEIVSKQKAKADGDIATTATGEDQKSALADLARMKSEEADLHGSCDFTMKNFDIRQAARDEEVDALKQAKAVLRGANFSFLARAG